MGAGASGIVYTLSLQAGTWQHTSSFQAPASAFTERKLQAVTVLLVQGWTELLKTLPGAVEAVDFVAPTISVRYQAATGVLGARVTYRTATCVVQLLEAAGWRPDVEYTSIRCIWDALLAGCGAAQLQLYERKAEKYVATAMPASVCLAVLPLP